MAVLLPETQPPWRHPRLHVLLQPRRSSPGTIRMMRTPIWNIETFDGCHLIGTSTTTTREEQGGGVGLDMDCRRILLGRQRQRNLRPKMCTVHMHKERTYYGQKKKKRKTIIRVILNAWRNKYAHFKDPHDGSGWGGGWCRR